MTIKITITREISKRNKYDIDNDEVAGKDDRLKLKKTTINLISTKRKQKQKKSMMVK